MAHPNWRVAVGLSTVPGAGHLYAGRPGKGLFFFLASLLPITSAVGFFLHAASLQSWVFAHFGLFFLLTTLVSAVLFLGVFIIGLYFWGSAFIDARATALDLAAGRGEAAAEWRFFHLS